MLKKFVVLIACLGVLQLSSCTSKDSKEDGGDELAIDATDSMESSDSAEIENVEGEQSLDIAADDPAASLSTDTLPEDALGESAGMDAGGDMSMDAAMDEAPPADPMIEETLPSDVAANEPPLVEETLPPDIGDIGSVDSAPPLVETSEPPVQETTTASSRETVIDDSPREAKPLPSYRKVEHTPWRESGKLLNAVYVARAGDSWSSVSTMIYGSEKVSELKKMNPALKNRRMKVGDKIYYNSPHRPDDDTKVLTYFEDTGVAPEIYIAKSGDNLKRVANELFGSEQGWKELYATNDFESKGALDEGTQIRYWKSAPAAVASTETAPPAEMPPAQGDDLAPPPPQQAQADMPPPPDMAPPMDMGVPPADMAPPPPPPDMAMNDMAPPPPPPPVEAIAPPPPPPMDANRPQDMGGENVEDDQMTTLAAGAVVAVGLALFMIMRRRRKKELEQAIQDTQVG